MGNLCEYELNMGIPLLGLVPKILKAASSILGIDSVKDVVDAISNNKLTPEQRMALEQAMREHEKEMRALDVEEMKTFVLESVAMIQSTDKFTSRARPTGLYLAYILTGFVVVVKALVDTTLDVGAALMLVAPFWGAGVQYQYLRSKEKMNGGNGD